MRWCQSRNIPTPPPFTRCDHHLFAVQPDIPLLDALEYAAVYLSCAEALKPPPPPALNTKLHRAGPASKCLVLRARWFTHPLTGCTRPKLEVTHEPAHADDQQ
ncbi:DUF3077 domain-containing protein [Pseudomonas sp. LS2P72]